MNIIQLRRHTVFGPFVDFGRNLILPWSWIIFIQEQTLTLSISEFDKWSLIGGWGIICLVLPWSDVEIGLACLYPFVLVKSERRKTPIQKIFFLVVLSWPGNFLMVHFKYILAFWCQLRSDIVLNR